MRADQEELGSVGNGYLAGSAAKNLTLRPVVLALRPQLQRFRRANGGTGFVTGSFNHLMLDLAIRSPFR